MNSEIIKKRGELDGTLNSIPEKKLQHVVITASGGP